MDAFEDALPETFDDTAFVEGIIGELRALADNVERYIPQAGRVEEGPVFWNVPGTSFADDLGPLNPLLLGQISSAPGELAWADGLLDTVGTITTIRRAVCTGWTVGGGAVKVIASATGVGAPVSQAAYWTGVGACQHGFVREWCGRPCCVGVRPMGAVREHERPSHGRPTGIRFAEAISAHVLDVIAVGPSYTTEVSTESLHVDDVTVGWFESFGDGSARIAVTNNGTEDAAVRGALYVYRKHDSTYDELVVPPVANAEGDLILAPRRNRVPRLRFQCDGGHSAASGQVFRAGVCSQQRRRGCKRHVFPGVPALPDVSSTTCGETVASGEIEEGGTFEYEAVADPNATSAEFTLGYAGSDLDLHIYDGAGRHVGFNYESGTVDLEIPGAGYSGTNSFPETITVPIVDSSNFQVQVVAVDTNGPEDFFVLLNNVGDHPATLVSDTDGVYLEGDAGEDSTHTFALSELGGQEQITDLEITVTDLISSAASGTIPADAVTIDTASDTIAPGGAIDVEIAVSIPHDAHRDYSGEIHVSSTQGSLTIPLTVSVANVAPSLGDLSATAINENDSSTLTGSITDPDTLDTFTLLVDWGDGTTAESFSYPAGTSGFSETHQYVDDDGDDSYTISVTVTDDDEDSDAGSVDVTVTNVAPSLSDLSATTVEENGTSTLTGTITDPGTLGHVHRAGELGRRIDAGVVQLPGRIDRFQ